MRRKDREVTEFGEIVKIIDACDTVRLGLADGDYPYIVPVNFAYTVEDERICIYIHGAEAGRKYELLQRNRVCSFEMDIPLKMECLPEKKDVTMRYRSVMGKAQVRFLTGDERRDAVAGIIMARYPETRNFNYNRDTAEHTAVVKLTVTELTAKANPTDSGADIKNSGGQHGKSGKF